MKTVSNIFTGLAAAAICAFISLMAMDAGIMTMAYNLAFLGIMLFILLFSWIFGFRRINQTVRGLGTASKKLINIYKNKENIAEITVPGAEIFGVEYLDHKYQEYLAYLRKTNSPCDIGDYIGEYEINNYIHRKTIEMVPDILTSLGILGTFLGLVWGLRGFDPQTYEAMASSVSSLVNGIKVAFITSIYGISLSIVFNYWLRGALREVSESLDNFLDKYYLCAVTPTDATAMNHVIANQKEQTKIMKDMADEVANSMQAGFDSYIGPAVANITQTMDDFAQVVTMNQEQLLENVAKQVMSSMKKEILGDFTEMRTLLKESNKAQREYISLIADASNQLKNQMASSEEQMVRSFIAAGNTQEECLAALKEQQDHLTQFVDYMAKVMEHMADMNDVSAQTLAVVNEQLDKVTPRKDNEDLQLLAERVDQLVTVMERQQKNAKKGLFR